VASPHGPWTRREYWAGLAVVTRVRNGRELGLYTCPACRLLLHTERPVDEGCPRCRALLSDRGIPALRRDRTTAFLSAAALLFVPANVLPVMTTATLLSRQSDTIMSGVVGLWAQGSEALALLVFFASIAVPALKITSLALLVASTRWWPGWRRQERALLFRGIERLGRWSMLDIMAMALLAALVRSEMARVQIEKGALAFAGVVVFTMLASGAFDPRSIWEEPVTIGPGRDREKESP
jgi:paraquat-inducible protein A